MWGWGGGGGSSSNAAADTSALASTAAAASAAASSAQPVNAAVQGADPADGGRGGGAAATRDGSSGTIMDIAENMREAAPEQSTPHDDCDTGQHGAWQQEQQLSKARRLPQLGGEVQEGSEKEARRRGKGGGGPEAA